MLLPKTLPRVFRYVITLICALISVPVFADTVLGLTANISGLSVMAGSPVTLTVSAPGSGLTYQWKKNGFPLAVGASQFSFVIASPAASHSGTYSVDVRNNSGIVTSYFGYLEVQEFLTPSAARPRSAPPAGSVPTYPVTAEHITDGFATGTTGGGDSTPVVVTNAADFKTQVESSSPAVITVAGTINLRDLQSSVLVKSNKTIQGQNASATIVGALIIGPGVSNVTLRGLTLTFPTLYIAGVEYGLPSLATFDSTWNLPGPGSGAGFPEAGDTPLRISGASRIFVTHCSFFDAEGYFAAITSGADNVTFSWCEFYYQPSTQPRFRLGLLIGAPSGETKPIRVTLHHNWWSDLIDQRTPITTYGQVHQYSDHFKPASGTPNTSATTILANARLLSERNVYQSVTSPLSKSGNALIRVIDNTYVNTTGAVADAGTDTAFVPAYSYTTSKNTDLEILTARHSGNTDGVNSFHPVASIASISGPTAAVTPGGSFTLNSTNNAFGSITYQWRVNNAPIAGATSSSYSITNAQLSHSGTYNVALTLANGETLVSTPLAITVGTTTDTPPASNGSNGGGGGGSPSLWFFGALSVLVAFRQHSRK